MLGKHMPKSTGMLERTAYVNIINLYYKIHLGQSLADVNNMCR